MRLNILISYTMLFEESAVENCKLVYHKKSTYEYQQSSLNICDCLMNLILYMYAVFESKFILPCYIE